MRNKDAYLGVNIKRFMHKKGMTAKELAKRVGISATHLSYVSNQKRKASPDIIEKIADVLGVSVERLEGESLSSIIEDRLEEKNMTLEELAKKASVPLVFLQKLDEYVSWLWGGPQRGYDWITQVAMVLDLPGGQLRAALARLEMPQNVGDNIKWVSDLEEIEHRLQDPLITLRGRLILLRQKHDCTPEAIADLLKIDRDLYAKIEEGAVNPNASILEALAKLYSCTIEYLTGQSLDDPTLSISSTTYVTDDDVVATIPNFSSIKNLETSNLFLAPILGSIRGGPPAFASEEIEGWMYVFPKVGGIHRDDQVYYLRVTGDSMSPKYQPGDLVLIRQQPIVDNGEVAAVLIDGQEACLKKVYITNGDVWLHSTNPAYEPIKVLAEKVLILGKAMYRLG